MTAIEDLLRRTLAETPTATTTTDPLALVDSRVRRSRRRLAVGAGLAVAAVVAAVAVPLAALDGGHRNAQVTTPMPPSPTQPPTAVAGQPDVWVAGAAHGVATNDDQGHSFVVTDHGSGATRRLVELDAKGAEIRHFTLPESALFVAQRDGLAWVWGGGDGGFPTATVTAVDLRTGATSSLDIPQYGAVFDLVITDDRAAWAVVADHVLRLELSDGTVKLADTIPLIGAQRIVVTAQNELWVQADTHLVELIPGGGGPGNTAKVRNHHWTGGALLAATHPLGGAGDQRAYELWVQTGPRQVGILTPQLFDSFANLDGRATNLLDVPGRPAAVAEDGIGGLYVALEGGGLVFYDFGAVKAGGPPTNRLARDAVDVETMAPTLDGGVIIQDFGGNALHWRPPTS
jgi:hypothetical protein